MKSIKEFLNDKLVADSKSALIKKYVQVGIVLSNWSIKPLTMFIKHLLIIQDIDPKTELGSEFIAFLKQVSSECCVKDDVYKKYMEKRGRKLYPIQSLVPDRLAAEAAAPTPEFWCSDKLGVVESSTADVVKEIQAIKKTPIKKAVKKVVKKPANKSVKKAKSSTRKR